LIPNPKYSPLVNGSSLRQSYYSILIPLFFIAFSVKTNKVFGQAKIVIPTCEYYKNTDAFAQKIKTIEVYNDTRKIKIARYEFDSEGYLLSFDTLLEIHGTLPSQKKYVKYLMRRNQIIDSTVNLSKDNGINVPYNSARITTILCKQDTKEVKYVEYELTKKYPEMKTFHFNSEGNCDTIYRIRGGQKDVLVYFNFQKGYGEMPAFTKSINSIDRSYMDYSFNNQNKIVYSKDYTDNYLYSETNYEYNAEGLLISEVTYGDSPYHRTFEANDKKKYTSNTFMTNYLYRNKKLMLTISYFCYREFIQSGHFKYKILDSGYITEYKYTSTGLLQQVITNSET
jgi:hypothetical protein